MKERIVDWMITQIFLSETGVHEVYVHHNSHKLRCNCAGFETRNTCKHTRFVKDRMNLNGGVYPVEISNKVDREQSATASEDPEAFRQLLVNYGKIEIV
jgi:hypothetical protein